MKEVPAHTTVVICTHGDDAFPWSMNNEVPPIVHEMLLDKVDETVQTGLRANGATLMRYADHFILQARLKRKDMNAEII